jgi:hypothetical protein
MKKLLGLILASKGTQTARKPHVLGAVGEGTQGACFPRAAPIFLQALWGRVSPASFLEHFRLGAHHRPVGGTSMMDSGTEFLLSPCSQGPGTPQQGRCGCAGRPWPCWWTPVTGQGWSSTSWGGSPRQVSIKAVQGINEQGSTSSGVAP